MSGLPLEKSVLIDFSKVAKTMNTSHSRKPVGTALKMSQISPETKKVYRKFDCHHSTNYILVPAGIS